MRNHFCIWNVIWWWDNTAKTNIAWARLSERTHRAHWALVVLGCIGLFVLRTRLNRAFRSLFRFVSDNISEFFCTPPVAEPNRKKSSPPGWGHKACIHPRPTAIYAYENCKTTQESRSPHSDQESFQVLQASNGLSLGLELGLGWKKIWNFSARTAVT